MDAPAVALIIDVSRSREHADRRALQDQLLDVFAQANELVPALQPIEPTVGDEFQAAYPNLATALRATLVVRLLLPAHIDCRFGLGAGQIVTVGESRSGMIQDGSAWWSARESIDEAHKREYAKLPFVRSWYKSGDPTERTEIVNAYLLSRDHLLGAMKRRERALLLGQLLGDTQRELAERENITQSAVSQNLHRSGAMALLVGAQLLEGASA
ncbi:MAG: SatD family protein [Microbacteriaceae bacterium]